VKRVKEHIASLRERIRSKKNWLVLQKKKRHQTERLVLKMEKQLGS